LAFWGGGHPILLDKSSSYFWKLGLFSRTKLRYSFAAFPGPVEDI
jgi:hypothetical protein